MDPTNPLSQVEALYRQVLSLTLRQEECLAAGTFDTLPAIVGEQMEILGRAEALLYAVGHSTDRSDQGFQEGIQRLASILADVVASEERCKGFAPPPPAPVKPPQARVLAAYGRR